MPKASEGSKVEQKKTRLEIIKDDGRAPHYPPLYCAQYLIDYLFEVGPIISNGMGTTRITNTELAHWQYNVSLKLQPWESRFIVKLSGDYLAESHRADEHGCPAPWQSGIDHVDKAVSVTNMKNSIRALANL